MTLEEKARKYVADKADKGNFDVEKFGKAYFSECSMENAYIAGAKENGTVWHDLRKDPNDLPKNTRQVLCAENGGGYSVGEYWEFEGGWGEDRRMGEEVIAWTEIPKYEVEE